MMQKKKFNEKVQDIILFAGSKKDAGEILGVSESIIDEFLEMESPPNEAVSRGIDEALKDLISGRIKESESELSELEEFEPASGFLDRGLIFFDGQQVQDELGNIRDNLKPDENYNLGLQIFRQGEVTKLNIPIQGEDLINASNWESIAWEYAREIFEDFSSQITVKINSIG